MNRKKAEKITRIYDWTRFIIVVLFLIFLFVSAANAQTASPEIHGILRGKLE